MAIHDQVELYGKDNAFADIKAGDEIHLADGTLYEIRDVSVIYSGKAQEAYAVMECDVTKPNGRRYIGHYITVEDIANMFNDVGEYVDEKGDEDA